MAKHFRRILVTGGAGFIGSHLCEYYLKKGCRVVAVDNFLTGLRKNAAPFLKNRHFEFIQHDLSRPLRVKGALNAVLHFASPASPPDYLRYPLETLAVGSIGTRTALELARQKRAIFMLASTSEVYGDPLVHPQKENYNGNVNPVGPRSVYDESKRFAEALTMAYHRLYKLNVKIVRIFNTYGPRMRPQDGRVIPNFMTQALLGKPLTIYGEGSQTRSYCYIDDLVAGIDKFLYASLAGPVNLGNPNEMSVRSLARVILNLTGSQSRLVYRPLPADDPRQRRPDITLARKALGWAPRVPLREGLEATLDYFKRQVLKRS